MFKQGKGRSALRAILTLKLAFLKELLFLKARPAHPAQPAHSAQSVKTSPRLAYLSLFCSIPSHLSPSLSTVSTFSTILFCRILFPFAAVSFWLTCHFWALSIFIRLMFSIGILHHAFKLTLPAFFLWSIHGVKKSSSKTEAMQSLVPVITKIEVKVEKIKIIWGEQETIEMNSVFFWIIGGMIRQVYAVGDFGVNVARR